MRNVMALLRRELNAYFMSVVGYVMLMFFLLVMGFLFWSVIAELLQAGPTQMTVMQRFFYWFWLPSLFVVPAMTMRLLAEEKRSGSIELLMTAPVTDFQVVFAKYLGAVLLYAIMWGLTGFYIWILRSFAGEGVQLDWGPICAGYIGVMLIGQFLVALGVLCSALTKNQVAAFLIAFALIFLYIIGTMFGAFFLRGTAVGPVFEYVSAFEQMRDFIRGIVDIRPVVFYVTGTLVVLFITTRVVESRKWR